MAGTSYNIYNKYNNKHKHNNKQLYGRTVYFTYWSLTSFHKMFGTSIYYLGQEAHVYKYAGQEVNF